jgi:hypothetical protein
MSILLVVAGSLLLEVVLTVISLKTNSQRTDTLSTTVSHLHDIFRLVGSDYVTDLKTKVAVLEGTQSFVWDTVQVRPTPSPHQQQQCGLSI